MQLTICSCTKNKRCCRQTTTSIRKQRDNDYSVFYWNIDFDTGATIVPVASNLLLSGAPWGGLYDFLVWEAKNDNINSPKGLSNAYDMEFLLIVDQETLP